MVHYTYDWAIFELNAYSCSSHGQRRGVPPRQALIITLISKITRVSLALFNLNPDLFAHLLARLILCRTHLRQVDAYLEL